MSRNPLLRTRLLGIRAVIAEGYERIHRSDLVSMGILPLQFTAGQNAASLDLTGEEVYDIDGLAKGIERRFKVNREVTVHVRRPDGDVREFKATVGIDTPQEVLYYKRCCTTSTAGFCSR